MNKVGNLNNSKDMIFNNNSIGLKRLRKLNEMLSS